MPSRIIKIGNPSYIEILTIEITIHKNNILAAGIYKPLNLSETNFTTSLETIISKLSNSYPSCIDLLLTNLKPNFTITNVFETGISDHHKMISTVMKLHFTLESPTTKYYWDYRKFDIDYFRSELSQRYTQNLYQAMKTFGELLNPICQKKATFLTK